VHHLFIKYLLYTFILVVTPGSTTAVVVRNTLEGGRAAGLAAATGAAMGNTSHATAAGLGLAVVFARWPLALGVLRFAGAGFFAWLGLVSLYRSARVKGGFAIASATDGNAASSNPTAEGFRQGFAANILNPSIISFYLIIVPSFLPTGAPHWYFGALAAVHIALAFTCHGLWAVGFARLRRVFQPPAARRALEAATGCALLALAVKVARAN
jgi:threonine/homoserine/homoserine lactone efflux protein